MGKREEVKYPDKWSFEEAICIAKCLRNKADDHDRKIADTVIGCLCKKCEEMDCHTEVSEMLQEAKERLVNDTDNPATDADFDNIMGLGHLKEQHSTKNFLINYTTNAGSADIVQDPTSDTAIKVTLADGVTVIGTTIAGSGTPDFVKILGIWLEYYLQKYVAFGFRSPIQTDSGNIIPLKVTISTGWSRTSPGDPININNKLGANASLASGYNTDTEGMGVTPGHELFHQVQYTFNKRSRFLRIYQEGTARWAEDAVNDAYNRYNKEVAVYLDDTTVSCFSVANKYGTVLFWKYLTEQLGTTTTGPQRGVDVMVSLWQNLEKATTLKESLTAINKTISALPGGVSLNDTFAKFAIANYVKDIGNPFINPAYDYEEDEHVRVPGGQVYSSVSPIVSRRLRWPSPDYQASGAAAAWGVHYYEFRLDPLFQDMTVHITTNAAFTDPFYRIIAIRGNEINIFAGTGSPFTQIVINDTTAPYDKLLVIIGAFATGGDYDLSIS